MTKFKRGDIVEYTGGYNGRHEPVSFLGSVGIVRTQDAYVRVDWVTVADTKYVQNINGVNPDNLRKLGRICPSLSIA